MASLLPTTPASVEIENMVHTIVAKFSPHLVAVFGSRARGEARSDSDVDFLVVLDDGVDRRLSAVAIRLALNPRTLPLDVLVATPEQLVTTGRIPGTALYAALDEGVIMYKQPRAA